MLITKPFVSASNLEFGLDDFYFDPWSTIVLPELPSRSADSSGEDLALLETVEVDTRGVLQTEKDQGLMMSWCFVHTQSR